MSDDGPKIEVKAMKDAKGPFVTLSIDRTTAVMEAEAARVLSTMLLKVADAVDEEAAAMRLEQERKRLIEQRATEKRGGLTRWEKGQQTKKENQKKIDAWLKAKAEGKELPELNSDLLSRARESWFRGHPEERTSGNMYAEHCFHCGFKLVMDRVVVNGRSWLLCPGCMREMQRLEELNGCKFGELRPDGPKKGQRLWWSTSFPNLWRKSGSRWVKPHPSLEQLEEWVTMNWWQPRPSGWESVDRNDPEH